jgi:hypothetical protein
LQSQSFPETGACSGRESIFWFGHSFLFGGERVGFPTASSSRGKTPPELESSANQQSGKSAPQRLRLLAGGSKEKLNFFI